MSTAITPDACCSYTNMTITNGAWFAHSTRRYNAENHAAAKALAIRAKMISVSEHSHDARCRL